MPVFVDDITLACSKDPSKIDSVIQELSQHFKLQDLEPTTQLLGIQIHRDHQPNCLHVISQSQFISMVLAILSQFPLLSILALAYPPPCARMMLKP